MGTEDQFEGNPREGASVERLEAEDGYGDIKLPAVVREVRPPKEIWIRLALTQKRVADALRIPVGTWQN